MESKSNKSSNVFLFGLLFNLILTLGSLGFTCYSLHRLDSRLTAVEQDLLAVNSYQYELANHKINKPASARSRGSQMMKTVVKRAADSPSICRKCSSVCLNWNAHRNVSCSLLCEITSVFLILNLLYKICCVLTVNNKSLVKGQAQNVSTIYTYLKDQNNIYQHFTLLPL